MKKVILFTTLVLTIILTGCGNSIEVQRLNYLSSNISFYDSEIDAEEFFIEYLEYFINFDVSAEEMIDHFELGVTIEELESSRPNSMEVIEIVSIDVSEKYSNEGFLQFTLVFTNDGINEETKGSFKIVEENGKKFVIFGDEGIKHPTISLNEAFDFVWRYVDAYNASDNTSTAFCEKYYMGFDIYGCIEERNYNQSVNVSIASGLFYYDSENHYLSINKYNDEGYLIDYDEYYLHYDETGDEITVKLTREYTMEDPIDFLLKGRAGEIREISEEIQEQNISEEIYCNYLLQSDECHEVYKDLKDKGVKTSKLLEYNMYQEDDGVYYAIFLIEIIYNDDTKTTLNYKYYPIKLIESDFIFINLDKK